MTKSDEAQSSRADEAQDLLREVQSLIIPFIAAADKHAADKSSGHGSQRDGQGPRTVLAEYHPPVKLQSLLGFSLPDAPQGKDGLLKMVRSMLQYSVNTWDQGFLDKLYSSITPVGLASDLVLTALNTNAHVYQVAPALISVEKQTAKALATMYGLTGPHAGGITQPGGSAANLSSIVIARNNLYPETKTEGYGSKKFVLFTSAHGHYSLEKAAQILGFGSKAIKSIPVDEHGRMKVEALEDAIREAISNGETPLYVNATAGTTVLGSFDPIDEISTVCKRYGVWLHVDGSWGGPVIFSAKHKHNLLGSSQVDSLALCPHKMLGVPLTCTFLLGKDMREFHKAMTLPAGYLFHGDDSADNSAAANDPIDHTAQDRSGHEIWDLADLTPQCGRRGDALKLALSWIFYGTEGLAAHVDHAFDVANHLATSISKNSSFDLVSDLPPPCLQVCFYYNKSEQSLENDRTTSKIAKSLVAKGFMIDYAPGKDGLFFRVVVNGQTRRETADGLIRAIAQTGSESCALT